MSPELDRKLCEKYPEIFRDRHQDPSQSSMSYGFECDDGWYSLIDWLCGQIMESVQEPRKLLAYLEQKTPTDFERIREVREALARAEREQPVALQVKEKWGGLRFYISGGLDEHWPLIDMAESISRRICEQCGAMQGVQVYALGWHKALCEQHADQRYGQRALEYRNSQTNAE